MPAAPLRPQKKNNDIRQCIRNQECNKHAGEEGYHFFNRPRFHYQYWAAGVLNTSAGRSDRAGIDRNC